MKRRIQWYTHRAIRATMNAAPWLYLVCPIWSCGRLIAGGFDKANTHLLGHSFDQLNQTREKLVGCGYELQALPSCDTGETDISEIAIRIKCPACKTKSKNAEEFRHHLETDHLLAPGAAEHFHTWRRDVRSKVLKEDENRFDRQPCWSGLREVTRRRAEGNGRGYARCSFPSCSFVETWNCKEHPSFLRTAEEITLHLAPYRLEILRHYPEFLTLFIFREANSPIAP